jgi:hypothetical protein
MFQQKSSSNVYDSSTFEHNPDIDLTVNTQINKLLLREDEYFKQNYGDFALQVALMWGWILYI